MDLTHSLQGFDELYRKLNDLKTEFALNSLRSATAAGAQVIKQQAIANAPEASGTLKRAIYTKWIREGSSAEKQTFFVGVRRGKKFQARTNKKGKAIASSDAYYAPYVEFGHFTRQPGKGGRLRATGRAGKNNQQLAGQVQSGAVRWIAPRPFLLPAFDSKKEAAIEAMKQRLRDRLAKYAR